MSVSITVPDIKLKHFTNDAKVTLEKQVELYTDEIIQEAYNLEEGMREDGANKEITSTIILQAVKKNKIFAAKKNNGWLIASKIASPISLLLTGFLFDMDGFSYGRLLLLFVITLIIACISTVYQHIKE